MFQLTPIKFCSESTYSICIKQMVLIKLYGATHYTAYVVL